MARTHIAKWLTMLSFVLALALTAALAACGSDAPSGVTGPDRTASTPTETPASTAQTPTTTGSGDTPTATDAPTPAAATAPPAASGSAETDREALVVLYNATDGENWNRSDNWLSDAPLGEWEGVTTNNDGRVTELLLVANDLRGEIPAELGSLQPGSAMAQRQRLERGDTGGAGSLSSLTELVIHNNRYLMGEIPAELGRLSNLVQLDLSGNPFMEGEIPAELGSLSNLGGLDLRGSGLSGEIPPELGSLSKLELLNLSQNELSGEIPPELGRLSKLEWLDLNRNKLSGEIPPELGRLSNLMIVILGHKSYPSNDFSGCVPITWKPMRLVVPSHFAGLPFC